MLLDVCEGGNIYTLPQSRDTFCFLSGSIGKKNWDDGKTECEKTGFDGHLELRFEEDATFLAKLLYCGWDYINSKQPGKLG